MSPTEEELVRRFRYIKETVESINVALTERDYCDLADDFEKLSNAASDCCRDALVIQYDVKRGKLPPPRPDQPG